MRLSTKARYGLRAMLELARREGDRPVLMSAIADGQGLSRKYLHALLTSLRSAGLVRSVRGARGGYVLARDPKEITVLEIVEALEGPLTLVDCVLDERVCKRSSHCPAHGLWVDLSESVRDNLRKTTLDVLVAREEDALDTTGTGPES